MDALRAGFIQVAEILVTEHKVLDYCFLNRLEGVCSKQNLLTVDIDF